MGISMVGGIDFVYSVYLLLFFIYNLSSERFCASPYDTLPSRPVLLYGKVWRYKDARSEKSIFVSHDMFSSWTESLSLIFNPNIVCSNSPYFLVICLFLCFFVWITPVVLHYLLHVPILYSRFSLRIHTFYDYVWLIFCNQPCIITCPIH